MPEVEERIVEVLEEIRDLLRPVAEAYRDDYEERRRVGELLRQVVRGGKREHMYRLMNGARTQTDMAQEAGVHPSSVSRFVDDLSDADLIEVISEGGVKRPKAKYPLRWRRSATKT